MSGRKETCFVIMPFGDKKDAGGNVIDFNAVYRDVIQKAVEELEIRCVRCDEIEEAGSIDRDMFQHIYESDVAVVDITTLNPNVFYELGVRHALADCITVLLRREGTSIPFNIRGLRVISYADHDDSGREAARNAIKAFIENGRTKRGYGKQPRARSAETADSGRGVRDREDGVVSVRPGRPGRQASLRCDRGHSECKRRRHLGQFRKHGYADGPAFRPVGFGGDTLRRREEGRRRPR